MADKLSEAEKILLGSSGLRDDFDGTITKVHFGYDTQYNQGKSCVAIVDILPDGDAEPLSQFYSIGDGFEPTDRKGSGVRPEKGGDKLFNNQTAFSTFIGAAMEAGAREVLVGRVGDGVLPNNAALWDGELRFHFNQVQYIPYQWDATPPDEAKGIKAGKDYGKNPPSRLLPSEYLGMGDEKVTSKKAKGDDADGGKDDGGGKGGKKKGKKG